MAGRLWKAEPHACSVDSQLPFIWTGRRQQGGRTQRLGTAAARVLWGLGCSHRLVRSPWGALMPPPRYMGSSQATLLWRCEQGEHGDTRPVCAGQGGSSRGWVRQRCAAVCLFTSGLLMSSYSAPASSPQQQAVSCHLCFFPAPDSPSSTLQLPAGPAASPCCEESPAPTGSDPRAASTNITKHHSTAETQPQAQPAKSLLVLVRKGSELQVTGTHRSIAARQGHFSGPCFHR